MNDPITDWIEINEPVKYGELNAEGNLQVCENCGHYPCTCDGDRQDYEEFKKNL